jgi:transposase-like protein
MNNIIAIVLWIVTLVSLTVYISRPGKCPVCNSTALDYDYHGYRGDRPICKDCGWDSVKDKTVGADLDDIFLEGGK